MKKLSETLETQAGRRAGGRRQSPCSSGSKRACSEARLCGPGRVYRPRGERSLPWRRRYPRGAARTGLPVHDTGRTTRLHYRWAAFYSTQDCEHVPGRSPCARSGQASPAQSHFCSAGRTRPQLVENIHRSDDDESASCTPFSPKLTVRCKLGTRLGPVVDLSPPHHTLAPIPTLRERGQGDQREAGALVRQTPGCHRTVSLGLSGRILGDLCTALGTDLPVHSAHSDLADWGKKICLSRLTGSK